MTAEIAVLNKFGVALAADSAVTVDHFIDGEIKTKVYNTANKLFSLSKHRPVGIMFYNTVTLGGVPWETVIKCYRRRLGKDGFATLKEYVDDFFEYLNSKPPIFSDENIKDIIENNIFREFVDLSRRCRNKAVFVSNLDKRIAALEASEYIDGFDGDFGKDAVALYSVELDNAIKYVIKRSSYAVGLKRKFERLFELHLTKKSALPGYAGLVFAGFGEDEALPALYEYYVDIVVSGRVRCWRRRSRKITNTNPSEVVPLADSEAIKTLIEGINPAYRSEMMNGVFNILRLLPSAIIMPIAELNDQQKRRYIESARRVIPKTFKSFTEDMATYRKNNYTTPINLSISSLPIGELGIVAEAFLGASQVLKKVNPDLETVGGPVDIAVISKGDGFVWTKRKHYFDETINPSFKLKYLDQ